MNDRFIEKKERPLPTAIEYYIWILLALMIRQKVSKLASADVAVPQTLHSKKILEEKRNYWSNIVLSAVSPC